MAARLVRVGFEVAVTDAVAGRAKIFVDQVGGRAVANLAEATKEAESRSQRVRSNAIFRALSRNVGERRKPAWQGPGPYRHRKAKRSFGRSEPRKQQIKQGISAFSL
jgi:hypothetical protein